MAYKPQNFENGNALSAEELNHIEQGIVELENVVEKKQPVGNYITEESDPTVPTWAKEPTKPTYTADEVGADPKGTAESKVSGHNTNTESHNDIRLLIQGLTTRLNTLADSDDVTLDQMSELVAYIKSNRSLIEEVTTNKVNVSDIVNDLTTQIANRPLSANQGVVLKKLIDELKTTINTKIPTKVSELENDSKYIKESSVINNLTSQTISEPLSAKQGFVLKGLIDDLEADKAEKATTLAGYGITDGVKKGTFEDHTSDTAVHITADERTAWNAKADPSSIPTKTSQLTNDSRFLKAVPDEYVTSEELNNKGYATEAKINRGLYGLVKSVNNITPDMAGNVNIVGEDGSITRRYTWDDIAQGSTMIDLVIDSDGVNYGGYHKVSDEVPTLEQLQKGGTISFDEGGNGIVTMNYPEGDLIIMETTNGAAIVFNGLILAVVAYEDGVSILGNTFEKGVSFAQNNLVITHSLMIKDYPAVGITPIPVEYLPESHQFGETTVMSDTLTWDGDMIGKPVVSLDMGDDEVMNFCKVSEAVPTLEDLSNGVLATVPDMGMQELPAEQIMAGEGYIFATVMAIISEPNTMVEEVGLTFPETGIWLINQSGMYIGEVKINGYTGFKRTEIKKIEDRFVNIPRTYFYSTNQKLYLDEECTVPAAPRDAKNAYDKGQIVIIEGGWNDIVTSVNLVAYPLQVTLRAAHGDYQVGSAD